ncbi:unnamed protein product, partial [Didymodactylos carnosus]
DFGGGQETKTLTAPQDALDSTPIDMNFFNDGGSDNNAEIKTNAVYNPIVNNESSVSSFTDNSHTMKDNIEKQNNDLFVLGDNQQSNVIDSTNIANDDFLSNAEKPDKTDFTEGSTEQQQPILVDEQEYPSKADDKQSVVDYYNNETTITNDQTHFTTPLQQEEHSTTLSNPNYEQFDEDESASISFSSLTITMDEKRRSEIAEKDAKEEKQINELKQQAKNDLNQWYNERKKRTDEKRKQIKNDEEILRAKAGEKSVKQSCDWEKVLQLVDFSPSSSITKSKRDLSRMKSIMLNAKQSTKMPNGI